jgi:hypothetical protein
MCAGKATQPVVLCVSSPSRYCMSICINRFRAERQSVIGGWVARFLVFGASHPFEPCFLWELQATKPHFYFSLSVLRFFFLNSCPRFLSSIVKDSCPSKRCQDNTIMCEHTLLCASKETQCGQLTSPWFCDPDASITVTEGYERQTNDIVPEPVGLLHFCCWQGVNIFSPPSQSLTTESMKSANNRQINKRKFYHMQEGCCMKKSDYSNTSEI